MSPTVLLADPSVRLAGVRPRRRYVRVAPRRVRVRWTWLALGVLLAVAALGLGFLQTWPPLATVMSGSMAPTIETGDVVLLKRFERPARVGDVVSIPVPDEARSRFGYPPVVIHRIVAIDAGGIVTTKGDARKEPDPFTVPSSSLTTRVVATVPAAGRALAFLGSPLGLLWLVGGAALLIGMPLLERYRDTQRRVAGDRDGLAAALAAVTTELAALRDERAYELDEQARLAARAIEAQQHAAAESAARERLATEAHQQALAEIAERERSAAEAHRRALTESAERERRAAEAHQQALAESAEREVRLVAEAAEARAQSRAANDALTRHLDAVPALIERAIAEAFASAAPPPAPPAPVAPDLLGTFARPAKPTATPDLLGVLTPAAAWDSPPPAVAAPRRFAPPVNTFFA